MTYFSHSSLNRHGVYEGFSITPHGPCDTYKCLSITDRPGAKYTNTLSLFQSLYMPAHAQTPSQTKLLFILITYYHYLYHNAYYISYFTNNTYL